MESANQPTVTEWARNTASVVVLTQAANALMTALPKSPCTRAWERFLVPFQQLLSGIMITAAIISRLVEKRVESIGVNLIELDGNLNRKQ